MAYNDSQAKDRLAALEADNLKHADRAKAMELLANRWKSENARLISRNIPPLTLSEYKQSINYQPDDAVIFLAGADEAWLKAYQERRKKAEIEAAGYYARGTVPKFQKINEFIRVLASVLLVGIFISFLMLFLI